MDEESTKGNALADVACSLLTPCYHLEDDDSDGYYEGGDLDDGFVKKIVMKILRRRKVKVSCQGQHLQKVLQKVFLFI